MAEQRQKLRERYKLGFDRLAVVLFCLFAAAFVILALVVNDPYSLPASDSPERAAIETAVAGECVPGQIEALATLCRERVLTHYRWAHYSAALDVANLGWLYAVLLIGLFVVVIVPATRWVMAGFRTPQSPRDRKNGRTADS